MADERQLPPSFSPGRKWRIGFGVVASLAVAFAIVVMANYISRNFFFCRLFVSTQTHIKLAPQTIGLLKALTNDIHVTLYYDKDDAMFGTIAALVNEYHLANPKITVETVDYVRSPADAQKIKAKYKLNSPTDKDLVIFDCADRVKVVNGDLLTEYTLEAVPNEKEREFRKRPVLFNGEQMFSAMLLAVSNPKPLRACYLVSHGEHDAQKQEENSGYAKFIALVNQNYISVEQLTLLGTNTIPSDCNLLIIAGPMVALQEMELTKISRYLDDGGRLLAMFNYASIKKDLGLEKLLNKWGVDVGNQIVLDPNKTVNGEDILVEIFARHPAVNSLLKSRLHIYLPRTVTPIEGNAAADAPKVDAIAFTSQDSKLLGQTNVAPKSYPVVVAIEKGAVKGVANERGTTRIIVVGDSAFLSNALISSAANRDFAGAALNWLVDRPQLLQGIGPRPVTEFVLVMTQAQLKSTQILLLAGLPSAALFTALLVWLRRRS